jgi:hypothetical protein
VKENGASAAGNARFGVVIDFDDEVIEVIVPHQAVAALMTVKPDGTIVVAV